MCNRFCVHRRNALVFSIEEQGYLLSSVACNFSSFELQGKYKTLNMAVFQVLQVLDTKYSFDLT